MFYVPNLGTRLVTTVVATGVELEGVTKDEVLHNMAAHLAVTASQEIVKRFTTTKTGKDGTVTLSLSAICLTAEEYEKIVTEAFEAGLRSSTISHHLSRKI